MSKAAVVQLSKTLACEWAKDGCLPPFAHQSAFVQLQRSKNWPAVICAKWSGWL